MATRQALALREERIRMPPPPRRVFAKPQPLSLRSVEHPLDPAAKARGGFRLALPDRLQDFEHVIDGHVGDRAAPDVEGVVSERHRPLVGVLQVTPGRSHGTPLSLSAHSPNVEPSVALLAPFGFTPSAICARLTSKVPRAPASRAEPNPISVGLPRQRHKKVQRRPPFGETERYSPPPSAAKFLDGCH